MLNKNLYVSGEIFSLNLKFENLGGIVALERGDNAIINIYIF